MAKRKPKDPYQDWRWVYKRLEWIQSKMDAAHKSQNQKEYYYWNEWRNDLIQRWWEVYGHAGHSTAWEPLEPNEDQDSGFTHQYSHEEGLHYLKQWIGDWINEGKEILPFYTCNGITNL